MGGKEKKNYFFLRIFLEVRKTVLPLHRNTANEVLKIKVKASVAQLVEQLTCNQ